MCVDMYIVNQPSGQLLQRPGATYAHPRELLSTLGHSCLCLTQHPADQWLVREAVLQWWFWGGVRCWGCYYPRVL